MSDDADLECLRAYVTCITTPISKIDEQDHEGVAVIINKMSYLLSDSLFTLKGIADPESNQDLAQREIQMLWDRLVCTTLTAGSRAATIGWAQLRLMELSRDLDKSKLPERYAMILAFIPDDTIKREAYRLFENLVPS